MEEVNTEVQVPATTADVKHLQEQIDANKEAIDAHYDENVKFAQATVQAFEKARRTVLGGAVIGGVALALLTMRRRD